ncbi:Retrotransposase [Fusarium oxysporum f. sp. albedinis]|nr:Retrotransposase [Fusarium oxysporum f. sp. albedinis]
MRGVRPGPISLGPKDPHLSSELTIKLYNVKQDVVYFPITLSNGEDLPTFKEAYENKQKSGLVKHGGSILRYVDIPQVPTRPIHRTESLDYGIVIAGELECRTMHQWIKHTNQWARVIFVLFHASPLEIAGKRLAEDQNGMGVPGSH